MMEISPAGDEQETARSASATTRVASASGQSPAAGTYCPRCGLVVPLERDTCEGCGHAVYHTPSSVQKVGLLSGMGFIILAGILIFLQPKQYHTLAQDIYEGFIILCVIGAGIAFFVAVADMVRRGGE